MTENRNKQTKKEEETEYNLIKIQVPLKVSCEKGKKGVSIEFLCMCFRCNYDCGSEMKPKYSVLNIKSALFIGGIPTKKLHPFGLFLYLIYLDHE